ncbi:MAG: electron transport complex subunit RsxC [Bacteroidales bacterium]|jgi:electron transport complex protein RnfC|nr:electron transport complex subunit RsxC [Bacteroidales bacterium]MCI1785671.1 electron transport complex subunit RsxC [Bacteroidales bacterium]
MSHTFSIGGIHPGERKISRDCSIEAMPVPDTVYISVAQHIGAPAKPIVAVGDKVVTGQPIAEPGGFVSAYIHSSVSGTVKSIGPRKDLAGKQQTTIEISVEGDEWAEDIDRTDSLVTVIPDDNKAILEKIRTCGVVGLGGATFPTHVKLSPPPGKKCETLIINGCECEPYLTSDFRTMMEKGEQVVVGTAIIKQVLGVDKAVIAIEDNKPEAISHMKEIIEKLFKLSSKFSGISVMPMISKYPEGGEKQLIDAVMHRQVKSGGLPIDVGAVVQNIATALAIYDAVQKNKPIIENSITVTGDCLEKQRNLMVRVGTPLSYIMDYAGGIPADAVKIISGGPMMGKAVSNPDAATLKGTSAILFLTSPQTERKIQSQCIRCGRCAEACPMGLEPFLLNKLALNDDDEGLEANAAQDCIECGCCLYSCPANIPLLDVIRVAKAKILGIIKARAKAAAQSK